MSTKWLASKSFTNICPVVHLDTVTILWLLVCHPPPSQSVSSLVFLHWMFYLRVVVHIGKVSNINKAEKAELCRAVHGKQRHTVTQVQTLIVWHAFYLSLLMTGSNDVLVRGFAVMDHEMFTSPVSWLRVVLSAGVALCTYRWFSTGTELI